MGRPSLDGTQGLVGVLGAGGGAGGGLGGGQGPTRGPVRPSRSGAAETRVSADPLRAGRPPHASLRAGLSSSRARAGGIITAGVREASA